LDAVFNYMNVEWVQRFCMDLPHATQTVQWEDSLVFKVGGKMFAVAALEPRGVWLSFKCSAEDFAELTERSGIIPAPYLARASWVGLVEEDALNGKELREQLQRAYEMVLAKLPRKVRESLV
jgi:predicted DNA-binding protein (MmcQ/YjbR family)